MIYGNFHLNLNLRCIIQECRVFRPCFAAYSNFQLSSFDIPMEFSENMLPRPLMFLCINARVINPLGKKIERDSYTHGKRNEMWHLQGKIFLVYLILPLHSRRKLTLKTYYICTYVGIGQVVIEMYGITTLSAPYNTLMDQ